VPRFCKTRLVQEQGVPLMILEFESAKELVGRIGSAFFFRSEWVGFNFLRIRIFNGFLGIVCDRILRLSSGYANELIAYMYKSQTG